MDRDKVGNEEARAANGDRALKFLFGLGIGLGLALLFAPQSGDETRRWLSMTVENNFRRVRRRGRRLIFEAQDVLDRGEEKFSRVLKSGKNVLDSVADKLD